MIDQTMQPVSQKMWLSILNKNTERRDVIGDVIIVSGNSWRISIYVVKMNLSEIFLNFQNGPFISLHFELLIDALG